MKKYGLFLFISILLFSCEKTIKVSVLNQPPKLVVNAEIENGKPPLVALSSSLNFFSAITPEELTSTFIHDAVVTITANNKVYPLIEYSFTDTSGFKYYFYTIDTTNIADLLTGSFNTSYLLNIKTPDGKQYSSTTTIPLLTKLCDSLWWEPALNTDDTTLCRMFGKFTDPPGLGNYVRYFTKENDGPYLPGLNSTADDQVVDGITYTFQFDMGWDKNSTIKPTGDNYGFAHRGDTVTLKFCNIDKGTFDFWNTWDFAYQSYGNPFSSPIQVTSNISNDALGVFSGYAAQYKTLIIPK
ncbi:MAG: DUF4249 domain-containing protein [Chitinophagaceae bacterium]